MSSPSLLVIGLGNPGPDYAETRHNVGYRVVEALADQLRVSFEHENKALVAWGRYKNRQIGLAKPLTYMNRSGDAVTALCEHYNLDPTDLLVAVDDLNLPAGTIRLRPKGSSGGHNGLEHIAQRLGTTGFPRLRIGIGNDFSRGQQVDYVLSPFTSEQRPLIDQAIEDAVGAVLTTAREDLSTAMNRFN